MGCLPRRIRALFLDDPYPYSMYMGLNVLTLKVKMHFIHVIIDDYRDEISLGLLSRSLTNVKRVIFGGILALLTRHSYNHP
jgi:hypothetical protein